MPKNLFRLSPLLAALLVASTAVAKPRAPDEKLIFKKVEGGDLQLHVYKPQDWDPGDKRPTIVFFFGGGWVGGTPGQFYPHCDHLASKGMVAISAEYRTKKSHKTDPFSCVEDGKSAIRWVREHAAELGVDPAKIIAGGGSAGGHVAACTGTLTGFETGNKKVSSAPSAMVLFNPVCDTSPKGYGTNKLGDRWREISPLHHISKKTPPTCIFHGRADTTVPHQNAADFKAAMAKSGQRCELHSYDDAKHGFFNFGRGDGSAYKSTVAKMDSFLATLGYLPKDNDGKKE